ncbi:hypothetical protein LLG46_13755 [bacterium]|nr:hypothetical protein [bacterium]
MATDKRTFLTFDIGTTALKTALFADDGSLLALHASEYSFRSPKPHWAQQHADTYWQAAVEGSRTVIEQSGTDPSQIAAIGFSSQAQTFVPVDANGKPSYDAVVWVDKRADGIADEWFSDRLSPEYLKRISGFPDAPRDLSVFKIAWLMRNMPEARKAAGFLWIPDYLIYKMTGRAATDSVTASMGGLFDMSQGVWDAGMLDAAGIDESRLPDVLAPGSVAGELNAEAAEALGVRYGVPVCVGANDQIAGALGAGNVEPGIATETTGTSLAVIVTTEQPLSDGGSCIGRHPAEGLYYAMRFTNTSAIILKWFRDICSSEESYEEFLRGIVDIPIGCDGLTVLPHFNGMASNPNAKGAFIGLTLGHTRDHISRAIMESCCCLLRELLSDIGRVQSIRSLGGAANSGAWLQMKADMLAIEVERPKCAEAASLGAAMMAAAGIGRFKSIKEASNAWYRPSEIFRPNADLLNRYSEVYERYSLLNKLIYG